MLILAKIYVLMVIGCMTIGIGISFVTACKRQDYDEIYIYGLCLCIWAAAVGFQVFDIKVIQ